MRLKLPSKYNVHIEGCVYSTSLYDFMHCMAAEDEERVRVSWNWHRNLRVISNGKVL